MSSWWRRRPLLGFVLAGSLAFWALDAVIPWSRETIRIDARTVSAIVERETNLEARELTDLERDAALSDYVREELLVREAHRNGWHLRDAPTRERLIRAMRAALVEGVPPPTSAELRAFYQANAERYRVPESISFSHVYFEHEPADPTAVLRDLERGADFRDIGEPFPLGNELSRQSEHQLRGSLGSSFAEAVMRLESGKWAGPIASTRGSHFVRVDARLPSELPALDEIERFVAVDWRTERRRELREREMARIRQGYTIVER